MLNFYDNLFDYRDNLDKDFGLADHRLCAKFYCVAKPCCAGTCIRVFTRQLCVRVES